MIRRTTIAILALVLFSACAKNATTTTKTPESTSAATAAPTTTTNLKTRTATTSPHATSTRLQPSTAVAMSPQRGKAPSSHTPVPSARPSAKSIAQSTPKLVPTQAPKAAATAAPTPRATATAASTPAAVAAVGDIPHGKSLYEQHCANCHGVDAQGGMGPSLQNEDSRKNFAQTVAWIKNPALPMPNLYPGTLSDKDVLDIAAYVQSLK